VSLQLAPCPLSQADLALPSSELCPGANIMLEQAVFIWWANQTLTTQGNPTGDTRATLTIANADITCAIFAALNYVDHVTISSIQVDGARPTYGIYWGGIALIEIGGYTVSLAASTRLRRDRRLTPPSFPADRTHGQERPRF
jgi:hypothetical protein